MKILTIAIQVIADYNIQKHELMNELTIITGKVNLDTTYYKIKLSLEEIKEKHGTRTDLIHSMERSLADLQQVKISYDAIEKELRAALQQNFRLEKLLQEEKFKVKDLEIQLKTKNYEI